MKKKGPSWLPEGCGLYIEISPDRKTRLHWHIFLIVSDRSILFWCAGSRIVRFRYVCIVKTCCPDDFFRNTIQGAGIHSGYVFPPPCRCLCPTRITISHPVTNRFAGITGIVSIFEKKCRFPAPSPRPVHRHHQVFFSGAADPSPRMCWKTNLNSFSRCRIYFLPGSVGEYNLDFPDIFISRNPFSSSS